MRGLCARPGGRAKGRGRDAAGATRRPPPGDRVFGCDGANYLTSLKPTLPSGPVAYILVAIAAFISSRLSQALAKSRMYLSALVFRGSYPRTDTLVQIAQACGYKVELVRDDERIELEAE